VVPLIPVVTETTPFTEVPKSSQRIQLSAVNLQINTLCVVLSGCVLFLTPWESVYDTFVPKNQPKTSSFLLPYQWHSSSADYTRELITPSKDLASLLVCNEKKFFG